MSDHPPGAHTVLFVCTANVDRSPTAEWLYRQAPGIEARSAGIDADALHPLDDALMAWADTVMVMEQRHADAIRSRFPQAGAEIIVLGIEDRYFWKSPELIALLTERIAPHLGMPAGDGVSEAR